MERTDTLRLWLQAVLDQPFTVAEPIGDASSRRYFRVQLADGSRRMAMDAPPERNDLAPFLRVAALLRPAVRVPAVLASDTGQGFLLLEDLGDVDLQLALQALRLPLQAELSEREREDVERAVCGEAGQLYRWVVDSLLAMQQQVAVDALPAYGAANMVEDLDRFAEWYAGHHLGRPLAGDALALWERSRALLVARAQAQGKVAIHFDFHCRNLIVADTHGAASDGRVGILDFQDARSGPICYDLASLLKDMYVQWPEYLRLEVAIRYWEGARRAGLPVAATFDAFYADFELMGVFRQIRTLGTFARLAHRDGKTQYLADMPVALGYLRETCARYSELHPLYKLINQLTDFEPGVGYTF